MNKVRMLLGMLAAVLSWPVAADWTTIPYKPSSFDATTASGSDMCAQIAASATAINAVTTLGGVIDASKFAGTQHCAGSMFASWPSGSQQFTILLGAVVIQTDVSQVIPTQASIVGVTGAGWNSGGAPGGTLIQASNSFPTNTPVIDFGSGVNAHYIQLENLRVTCQPPSNPNPAGCIGIRNLWSEEGTTIKFVAIDGATDAGLEVRTVQAQNGGPYENISIGMNGVNNANALCMRIGNGSSDQLVSAFRNISCGGGANVTEPNIGIRINGWGIHLDTVHVESALVGIEVGDLDFTHTVRMDNVQCGVSMATCVDISNAQGVWDLSLMGVATIGGGGVTNTLVDHNANGCTITTQKYFGLYVRSNDTDVFSSSPECPIVSGSTRANFKGGIGTAPAALSTFGTCDATHEGLTAVENNSTAACVAGTTATSAGTVHCQIYCNASNWVQTGR